MNGKQGVPAWFGPRIRRERRRLGLSLQGLAAKSGLAQATCNADLNAAVNIAAGQRRRDAPSIREPLEGVA